MKRLYGVPRATYKVAQAVFRNPTFYRPKSVEEAERIIAQHDEGATFDRPFPKFRPRAVRNRNKRNH